MGPTLTSVLHALTGLASALFGLGPLPVAVLVVALVWWACSRLIHLAESEARRRPLFTAWLLWHWAKRRQSRKEH